jgi:hypothetical protein
MARVRYRGSRAQGSIHLANNTIVDGDYLTIGDKVYEFDDNAAVTAGRVLVTIGGNAGVTATNLINAINANKPSKPVTAVIDPVNASGQLIRLFADKPGAAGNIALSENVANAGLTVSGATLVGGENAGEQVVDRGDYVVTAADVLGTSVVIQTQLTSPRYATYQLYRAGAKVGNTGVLAVSGTRLTLDFGGGTDPEAGDIVRWIAFE